MDIASCLVEKSEIVPAKIYVFGPGKNNTEWQPRGQSGFTIWPHHVAAIESVSPPDCQINIFCPDPRAFNATLTKASQIREKAPRGKFIFRHGIQASGLVIPKGSAAMIASADCPTLVIANEETGTVALAHAGLGELEDLAVIRGEAPNRNRPSVITQLINQFVGRSFKPIRAGIFCGIGPTHFIHHPKHETWGEKNQRLIEYFKQTYPENHRNIVGSTLGQIDLGTLIRVQLEQQGLDQSQIWQDSLDTYTNPQLWSHRKETAIEKGKPDGRNLIVVTHW